MSMTTGGTTRGHEPVWWRAALGVSSAGGAAAWYTAAAVLMTWPLARGLSRDIPGDLGDSLFNGWVLAWGAEHLLRVLGGDLAAFAQYWHANIFHPEPLTLAYSEHLFAQVVQILPVYALTRNVVLCYNLLFLSTFVLSGLGMYLLVRDLTGNPRAAFLAGLVFAFAPYRVAQIPHLQVLSSQWMPFVLVGLLRHIHTGRAAPLAGATTALVLQGLSCGYYLLYFTPFAAALVLTELAARKRLFDRRQWAVLVLAGLVSAAAVWPFLRPYRELRALGHSPRPIGEVLTYSADVYSYLTASPMVHVDGRLFRAFSQPEGELFPGVVLVALALVALLPRIRRRLAGWWNATGGLARGIRAVALTLLGVSGAYLVFAAIILSGFGFVLDTPVGRIRVTGLSRALWIAVAALAPALAILRWARPAGRRADGAPRRPAEPGERVLWFSFAAAGAAAWLSFGPYVRTFGRQVADGPYLLLYRYVPGFDGLRVPARYGMVVLVFLIVLAGVGAWDLERRVRRGRLLVGVACVLFLLEATAVPLEINRRDAAPGFQAPPARVFTGRDVPPVYGYLAGLPAGAAVIEFPFGEPTFEVDYVFYSTTHWRRLVNGYSGGFPASYARQRSVLRHPLENPEFAWREVASSGATHVVVHEAYFLESEGQAVSDWVREHGGREVALFEGDRVYELR